MSVDGTHKEVDGTHKEIAYCFNMEKSWPHAKDDYTFELDHNANMNEYAKYNPGNEAIEQVIYNGYPTNGGGLQGKLDDERFRVVTQLAIWHYTDDLNHWMAEKYLAPYPLDAHPRTYGQYFGDVETSQEAIRVYRALVSGNLDSPKNAYLNIYFPSASYVQSLVGVGWSDETGKPVEPEVTETPKPEPSTTKETTTAPVVTETTTVTPTTTVTDTKVVETRVTETTTTTLPAKTETVTETAPVVTDTTTSTIAPVTETKVVDGGTTTTTVKGEPTTTTEVVDGEVVTETKTNEPTTTTTFVDGGAETTTVTNEPVVKTEYETPTTTVTEPPGVVTVTETPEPVTTTVTTTPAVVTQVVAAPWIGTSAYDKDGGKDDKALEPQGGTVVDTVIYVGLTPGKEYEVKGELVDKHNGGAQTGIIATKTFTPEKSEGSVNLEFKVPAGYEGRTLVAFEELTLDGEVVAEHKNLDSVSQTIVIGENTPLIKTNAKDKADNDRFLSAEGSTVVDTVDYMGLKAGTYTVKGELIDIEAGEGTGIVAEETFSTEKSEGFVNLEFEVPAGYEGKTLVVFEKLYDVDGKLIAAHVDHEDIKQTVVVAQEEEPVFGSSVSPWWLLVPVALLGLIGIGGLGSSVAAGGSSEGSSVGGSSTDKGNNSSTSSKEDVSSSVSNGGSNGNSNGGSNAAGENDNSGRNNGGAGNGTAANSNAQPAKSDQSVAKDGAAQNEAQSEGGRGALANTGADVWMLGLAAIVLMVLGGALMIRRRGEA